MMQVLTPYAHCTKIRTLAISKLRQRYISHIKTTPNVLIINTFRIKRHYAASAPHPRRHNAVKSLANAATGPDRTGPDRTKPNLKNFHF